MQPWSKPSPIPYLALSSDLVLGEAHGINQNVVCCSTRLNLSGVNEAPHSLKTKSPLTLCQRAQGSVTSPGGRGRCDTRKLHTAAFAVSPTEV